MGLGIMRKNRTEKIEEYFREITRRIDNLTTQLFASDSEIALNKIKEHEKRIDNIIRHLAMNDNEFRIFRDAVFAIQRELYPKLEDQKIQNQRRF